MKSLIKIFTKEERKDKLIRKFAKRFYKCNSQYLYDNGRLKYKISLAKEHNYWNNITGIYEKIQFKFYVFKFEGYGVCIGTTVSKLKNGSNSVSSVYCNYFDHNGKPITDESAKYFKFNQFTY